MLLSAAKRTHNARNRCATVDASTPVSDRISRIATFVIQGCVACGLVVFIVRADWENTFLTVTVLALTLLPALVSRRCHIYIPPDFQLVVVVFVFLTLFLGSVGDLYHRVWWWDIVLHAGSGFLLGIVGWIVLFLLIQTDRLPRSIRPSLVCFFGVTFAVFVGVLWEIFEFAVDSIWPAVNMMSHETGVSDTMHDLIVDTLGAILVGLMGWAYSKSGRYSFLVEAIRRFMQRNPRFFRQSTEQRD
jgi:hypothetical protein